MGDMCNQERNRSRKRIGKRKKKALKQLEDLVSARSPLGTLTYWFTKVCRPFRKHIRSTGRCPARQLSCRRPILQEPIALAMDSLLSTPQDYLEERMCPPGTEGSEYNAGKFFSGPYGRLLNDQIRTDRNGGFSLQSCATSAVNSHHSTETKDLVVDLCCISSTHSHQFQTCLESSSNCGSHESRAGAENHKRKVEENMSNPKLAPDAKIRIVDGLWNRYHDSQNQKSEIEIWKWKHECISLRNSKADLRKVIEEYKEDHIKEMSAQKRRAEHLASKNRQLEGANDELTRQLKNSRNSIVNWEELIQQKHDEILLLNEEVQSLNSTVADFQKPSHEHALCGRPMSANLEGYAQQNAISGSYVAESATPLLLDNALSSAKGAVKRFQKALTDAIKFKGDIASTIKLLQPDMYFARDNHVSFAARAVVYGVLFEGFENESFNTCSGVSRFLDPDVRQTEFFKYFLCQQEQNENGDIGDPHFESFCEMKVPRLWEEFNLRKELSNKQSMQVACFETLGGPKVLSSFREAAKKVWLLHKLAFSFEPPASIFRVEQGAAVDTNYMEPVVSLEDSSRFVNEVGFMVSPGLRLRKTTLRSEVYLSSAKFPTA